MLNLSRFNYIYKLFSNTSYCYTNKLKNVDLKILKANYSENPCPVPRISLEDFRKLRKIKEKKNKSTCAETPKLGKFNIFAEQCHWIRQLQGDEEDPTHGGEYFHHQMYHKYTYFDVEKHMVAKRLPQPSVKTPLHGPTPPPPAPRVHAKRD